MNTPYQTILMDHYKYPRNRRLLIDADFSGQQENVHCGDRVRFAGRVCAQEQRLLQLAFEGTGCVLSQAIASIISEKFTNAFLHAVIELDELAYIEGLVGSSLGPTRLKCALLSLEALRSGIVLYQQHRKNL